MKNHIHVLTVALSVMIAFAFGTDTMADWRPLETGTDVYLFDVAFANDSVGIALGPGTTILRTCDGGLNWDSRLLDYEAIFYSADFGQDSIGAILIGSALARTTDTGQKEKR